MVNNSTRARACPISGYSPVRFARASGPSAGAAIAVNHGGWTHVTRPPGKPGRFTHSPPPRPARPSRRPRSSSTASAGSSSLAFIVTKLTGVTGSGVTKRRRSPGSIQRVRDRAPGPSTSRPHSLRPRDEGRRTLAVHGGSLSSGPRLQWYEIRFESLTPGEDGGRIRGRSENFRSQWQNAAQSVAREPSRHCGRALSRPPFRDTQWNVVFHEVTQ